MIEKITLITLTVGAILVSLWLLKRIYKSIKTVLDNKKEFKRLEKKVKEMKENSELHKWIKIDVYGDGAGVHVCQKTGWCPTIGGFIPMHFVLLAVKKMKYETDYKEYYDKAIGEIAAYHDMDKFMVDRINNKLKNIPQEFNRAFLLETAKELEELGENSERN